MGASFVDRLLEQQMQLFRLNLQYEMKQSQLKGYAEEEERLTKEVKVAEEEQKVVEQLRRRLDVLHKESEERYNAAQAEDQKEREAAAAALREDMNMLNDLVLSLGEAETKAAGEKRMLSKKVEILEQYKTNGSSKFDEALKERDERVATLRKSLEAQIAVKPQVEELLAKAEEKLAVSKPKFEEMKAKVDERKQHFEVLRARLDSSKSFYEEAEALNERHKKMIESIRNDIELALSRLDNTRQERNVQERRVHQLEEKIDTVQRQIIQITKVTDALLGKTTVVDEAAATENGNAEADAEKKEQVEDTSSSTPAAATTA